MTNRDKEINEKLDATEVLKELDANGYKSPEFASIHLVEAIFSNIENRLSALETRMDQWKEAYNENINKFNEDRVIDNEVIAQVNGLKDKLNEVIAVQTNFSCVVLEKLFPLETSAKASEPKDETRVNIGNGVYLARTHCTSGKTCNNDGTNFANCPFHSPVHDSDESTSVEKIDVSLAIQLLKFSQHSHPEFDQLQSAIEILERASNGEK